MPVTALRGAQQVPDTETENVDETPQLKPFAAFLREQRGGLTHSELSEALAEVAAAVREHQKAGSLTLTINIAPAKYDGAVEVSDTIKTKLPEADRHAGLFYPSDTGYLSRNDPRQPQLPGIIRDAGQDQARSAS